MPLFLQIHAGVLRDMGIMMPICSPTVQKRGKDNVCVCWGVCTEKESKRESGGRERENDKAYVVKC